MRIATAAATALATALLATLPATPAHADYPEFPITVTPAGGHPGDSFHVTGNATDPVCEGDGVVVSLFYTQPDGSGGAASVNTVTDSAGHFEADLTVPENAVASHDGTVSAVIADCTPPEGETQPRAATAVAFAIQPYSGTFAIDKTSGKPGQKLSFSGTNCWGGKVTLTFGTLTITSGVVKSDKTFSGSFTLPNVPDATYTVSATCPGTSYAVRSFHLINPIPVAPPAQPVPGIPSFTG